MADIFEVVLTMTLRPDIGDAELAELRWHLGLGPRPDTYPIGSDKHVDIFPLGDPTDPGCAWETAEPEPLFAERGAAHHVGGALVSELVTAPRGLALTVRQEVHPDSFAQLRTLLEWLSRGTETSFLGYLRFYEEHTVLPIVLVDGKVVLPDVLVRDAPEAH